MLTHTEVVKRKKPELQQARKKCYVFVSLPCARKALVDCYTGRTVLHVQSVIDRGIIEF